VPFFMKELTHTLLTQFVRTFAPKIDHRGICNGFTSMWLQAALTSKKDLAFFYQRLDELSLELKQKTPADLKAEIDSIYNDRAQNANNTILSDENVKKIEKRAFAEAVAIQQEPNKAINSEFFQHNKEKLYPLTASKKMEEQSKNLEE